MHQRKLYDLVGAEDARRFSPYCWRIKLALMHKGLEFQTIPWRFADVDKIKFAESRHVPVLVDGDRVIKDSWAIANYLEDTYASSPPIFGSDRGRAGALFVNSWTDLVLHVPIARIILLDIFNNIHESDKEYFRTSRELRYGMTLEQFVANVDDRIAEVRQLLSPLRMTLRERAFLGGEKPNYLDYIPFGEFIWARSMSPAQILAPDDPLYAWRERMMGVFDGAPGKALGYPI